jgi:hypothetical protein
MYNKNMTVVTGTTIKFPKQVFKDGMVVLSMKEYRELQMRAVPTYYLKGKAAKGLDKLVKDSLRDHKLGKTKRLNSLADLR